MTLGSMGAVSYDVLAKDKTAEGLDSASGRFKQMGTIAGAAMTAVGAGMTMMTDKARKLNAPLTATALQLGATTGEMRELVFEIGNVTFPLEQVIASMDLLTRAGMRNKEEIAATATAFDILGDATGKSASEITTMMIPAFNAFKLELKDAAEYTDLFTHMQRNTTVEMSDFSGMFKYIAPDIDAMGISLKQSIAVMEALAAKGIQGTSATKEFRTAVTQADGDLIQFYEALGLTEAEVGVYITELEGAEGITNDFANAMNTQYGFMDKLKYSLSEFTLKYGSMLQPVEAMGPAMMALGPIMIVVSNIHWGRVIPAVVAHTKALGGMIAVLFTSGGALSTQAIGLKLATAAQWLMNASLYGCPLVWIVLAIGGVVAVLYVLEKKFGVVTAAVKLLSGAIDAVIGFFGGVVDAIRGVAVDTDKLAEANNKLIEANERLVASEEDVKEAEEKAEESAEDLAEASAELAAAQLEVSDAAREVDVLTDAYEELKGAMDDVADETENLDDLDRDLRGANLDLADAQDKYTEALNDSEASSRDRLRAGLRVETVQDRIEGIKKNQIETTEDLTKAEGIAAETKKKYGDKSLTDLKTNLDGVVAANQDNLDNVARLEEEKEEIRKRHEFREEDLERVKLVYAQAEKDLQDHVDRKNKILEGEAKAGESAGSNLIKGIVKGINSMTAGGRMKNAIEAQLEEADKQLPHSDAEEGPFSDLEASGRSVVDTFAKGIDSAKGSVGGSFGEALESSSFSKASTGGSAGGDTYGGDSVSIGQVSLSRDYDFPALMKDIENYQSSKRVQRGIRTL